MTIGNEPTTPVLAATVQAQSVDADTYLLRVRVALIVAIAAVVIVLAIRKKS